MAHIDSLIFEVDRMINCGDIENAIIHLKKTHKYSFEEKFFFEAKIFYVKGDIKNGYQSSLRYLEEKKYSVDSYLNLINWLVNNGLNRQAVELLNRAQKKFPLTSKFYTLAASLYVTLNDYQSALRIILNKSALLKIDSKDYLIVSRLYKYFCNSPNEDFSKLMLSPDVVSLIGQMKYEMFESIGSDCEFGWVQNKNGFEPLSLFKGAAMKFDGLLKYFKYEGKNFPCPSTSSLKLDKNDENGDTEFLFQDKNYLFNSHSGYSLKDVIGSNSEELILRKSRAHFKMLSRKLQEDLEDAKKVFLFKSLDLLSREQCLELHDALCTSGNNKLLIIMERKSEQDSMNILRPNLMVNFIDRYWKNNPGSVDHKNWDSVIYAAYDHFLSSWSNNNDPS